MFKRKIVEEVLSSMQRRRRKSTWFGRLFDKDDNSVALSSVLIGSIGFICFIMLLVPVFSLSIESYYNHNVSSDIGGWAAYIGAVAGVLGIIIGGKVGINYADNKYNPNNCEFEEECCETYIEEQQ